MPKLQIAFKDRHITVIQPVFNFSRQEALRFEWIALLAYHRKEERNGERWVTISEIQRLPLWKDKKPKNVGIYVDRYLKAFELQNVHLVDWKRRFGGPYRLTVAPGKIAFDMPLSSVKKQLHIRGPHVTRDSQAMYAFTRRFCRALTVYSRGRLQSETQDDTGPTTKERLNARPAFGALALDTKFDPSLRALAYLWSARVLDRVGRYTAARKSIEDAAGLLQHVNDPVLHGQLHLASAWQYHRAGDRPAAENDLKRAQSFAERSFDQALFGGVEDRRAFHLSHFRSLHTLALEHRLEALKARIVAGDFERLQVSCHNIGETLELMGKKYFSEAKLWLKLGGEICRWMHVGFDRALAEIELARIALAEKRLPESEEYLEAADVIINRSQNQLGRMHYYILRAAIFRERRKVKEALAALILARKYYLPLRGLDRVRRDRELEEQFPEFWPAVLAATKGTTHLSFQSVTRNSP